MKRYESSRETEARIVVDALLAEWRARNERLDALNNLLSGRRQQPRPALKVIKGGRDA